MLLKYRIHTMTVAFFSLLFLSDPLAPMGEKYNLKLKKLPLKIYSSMTIAVFKDRRKGQFYFLKFVHYSLDYSEHIWHINELSLLTIHHIIK